MMGQLHPARRIVSFFDVDNTLLDNDRAKIDLWAEVGAQLGEGGAERFDALYEAVRKEHGLVNLPLVLERLEVERAAAASLSEAERRRLRFLFADIVMGFPYRDYLFPGALAAVRHARSVGAAGIFSEGDASFQPHKIWRTGLYPEVDGNVLVFDHKLRHLNEVAAAYPADHYFLIEDKPDILAEVKAVLGDRLTTILVRQGKYANQPLTVDPLPDVVLGSIAEFSGVDLAALTP